jgi:hypothetical protein
VTPKGFAIPANESPDYTEDLLRSSRGVFGTCLTLTQGYAIASLDESAASPPMPGGICDYVSRVMVTEACPSSSWPNFKWTLFLNRSERRCA